MSITYASWSGANYKVINYRPFFYVKDGLGNRVAVYGNQSSDGIRSSGGINRVMAYGRVLASIEWWHWPSGSIQSSGGMRPNGGV